MLWYARMLADVLVGRVQALHASERRDLGASALEWAIIAAIAVVIASIIGAVIYSVVNRKGSELQKCADQPVGVSCAT